MIKFYYNGIKTSDKKGLQKAFLDFRFGDERRDGRSCIKIIAREYRCFSNEIREVFEVTNGSDIRTDYFEEDRICIYDSNHPLIDEVIKSVIAAITKNRYITEESKRKKIMGLYEWRVKQ